MVNVKQMAKERQKSTAASMACELLKSFIEKKKSEAFSNIEKYGERVELQHSGVVSLIRIFQRRTKIGMICLSKVGQQMEAERSHFVQAVMMINRFFIMKNMQSKFIFFNEGKRLFELNAMKTPAGGKKPKLFKSPSLIVEVSQNYKFGFTFLTQFFDKKKFGHFK